ncbi:MAG: hypothetical protein PWP37_485 [Thermotogota bacterium]|nr:hypothetical protein [Thermotogota bacterium]MDK2864293.1 hypothetical protein [Thermotogota bacterium]HCZ05575.1 hypothetical protein [Thermotogota bacterium]
MKKALGILFITLLMLGLAGCGWLFPPSTVDVKIGKVVIDTVPRKGFNLIEVDQTVAPRLEELWKAGKLKLFYGYYTGGGSIEDKRAGARMEALNDLANFMRTRVNAVEQKVSGVMNQYITDEKGKEQLQSLTQSFMKRVLELATNADIMGARVIAFYSFELEGRQTYKVAMFFDPEQAWEAISLNRLYLQEYEKLKDQARAMGEAGQEFFKQLNSVLEEALKNPNAQP